METVALARIRGVFLQAISVACIGCDYFHASRRPLRVVILFHMPLVGALGILFFIVRVHSNFARQWIIGRSGSKLLTRFLQSTLDFKDRYDKLGSSIKVTTVFFLCAGQVMLLVLRFLSVTLLNREIYVNNDSCMLYV